MLNRSSVRFFFYFRWSYGGAQQTVERINRKLLSRTLRKSCTGQEISWYEAHQNVTTVVCTLIQNFVRISKNTRSHSLTEQPVHRAICKYWPTSGWGGHVSAILDAIATVLCSPSPLCEPRNVRTSCRHYWMPREPIRNHRTVITSPIGGAISSDPVKITTARPQRHLRAHPSLSARQIDDTYCDVRVHIR